MDAMTGNGFIPVLVVIALSLSWANLKTRNPAIAVLSAGMWMAVWWGITQNATLDDTMSNFLAIICWGASAVMLIFGLAGGKRRVDSDVSSEYQNYKLQREKEIHPIKKHNGGETIEEYRERQQRNFNRGRAGVHRR